MSILPRMTLRLLGGFSAYDSSGQPITLSSRKARVLLTRIAIVPGHEHPREALSALLWGHAERTHARNCLRQTLFTVRRALGPAGSALRGTAEGLSISSDEVSVDVVDFERLAADRRPEALSRAASLFAGELLAGVNLKGEPFARWVINERQRLRDVARQLLKVLVKQIGQPECQLSAVRLASELLTIDPMDEAAHRALMQLYAEEERWGEVERQYRECATALRSELGLPPQSQTTELYRKLMVVVPNRHAGAHTASDTHDRGLDPRRDHDRLAGVFE